MSNEESQQGTEGEEIAEVGVIARAEAERRRRGLAILAVGLIAVVLGVGGLIMLAQGDDGALGPKIELEDSERETLAETNDPQCRAMIADVTAFGARFKGAVPTVEKVTAAEVDEVKAGRAEVAKLREELEALRVASNKSNLRFDDSRAELTKWFKYVDTELRLLDLRGEKQLARLEAEARGETYVDLDAKKKKKRGKIVGEKPEPERTPEQKRDAAILAILDAFESFRVWHTAAMHPCGAADEGEQGWTPPAGEAAGAPASP